MVIRERLLKVGVVVLAAAVGGSLWTLPPPGARIVGDSAPTIATPQPQIVPIETAAVVAAMPVPRPPAIQETPARTRVAHTSIRSRDARRQRTQRRAAARPHGIEIFGMRFLPDGRVRVARR